MQVLYHLAERPELLIPLREEIDGAIAAEGWTMPSFARMWKLDSVLRESQRCNGFTLGMLPLSLIVLSPWPLDRVALTALLCSVPGTGRAEGRHPR